MTEKIYDSIQVLNGIGEKKYNLYEKLGVKSILDLLELYPRRYINYEDAVNISDAVLNESQAVKATVLSKHAPIRIRGGRMIYRATVGDERGTMTVTYFNNQYALMYAKEGETYTFFGKVTGTLQKKEMSSPVFIHENHPNKLQPIYPLTAGITSAGIAKDVKQAYAYVGDGIAENIPDHIRQEHRLCGKGYAIENIHFPKTYIDFEIAKRRLAFEEMFILQIALSKLKQQKENNTSLDIKEVDLQEFYDALPYKLTNAQLRCIEQCVDDFKSGKIMNRLIQGDVGSGKTVVAAAVAYVVIKSGYQAAIMAPTEILARQHLDTFTALFEPLGIKSNIVTGSMTAKHRRLANDLIQTGVVNFVVGTHAVLSNSVNFRNLGLVITDEQHRFGVSQRATFASKGKDVNTLVMSATPIPRTLALIIYGDLDISIINELPPGRQYIDTMIIRSDKRERALKFIKNLVDKGLQAYIVCPMVNEGEENFASLKSAVEYGKELGQGVFAGYNIGVLHGQMKPRDKENVMSKFLSGDISVLVSTTVVEVGVDVANAVVMMVENAERFGLSQLHQLRGRVGRGTEKSYCILLSDSKNETSVKRLGIMSKTNDGFKLAEEDLKIRGPGDFFGNRQHGLPVLKISNMVTDSELLSETNVCVNEILSEDPSLSLDKNREILRSVEFLYDKMDSNNLN